MINFKNKEKHKILFLLHIPPPVHGSSVVGQAIKESHFINDDFDCQYINLLASSTIADSGIVTPRKIVGFLGIWLKVLYSIILRRPKLCYIALTTSGAAFYRDLILVAVLKLFKIRHVYHLHNKGISRNQHKKINHICYNYVFKNAYVILLSKLLYSDIQNYVKESNVFICPNGIPDIDPKLINPLEPVIHNQLSSFNAPIEILFLSNLIKSKGVYVLLEACAILKERKINFHCTFIGGESDVSETDFKNATAKLNLDNEVNYVGKKFDLEKTKAFSSSQIFAFPTFYSNECFPLVLLEAMSFGLPIVTTYEGGIPDEVINGFNGFLVPQKNVLELASKLEVLINSAELRNKMGNAGRTKYQNEFTIEIFENNLIQILKKIIEKNIDDK